MSFFPPLSFYTFVNLQSLPFYIPQASTEIVPLFNGNYLHANEYSGLCPDQCIVQEWSKKVNGNDVLILVASSPFAKT